MKKQILNVVITMCVISALSIAVIAGPFFAGMDRSLKATIPFDFMVNGKTLPAGEYTVERSSIRGALVIRSWDTKKSVSVVTQEPQADDSRTPRLIFHRYGKQYFLAKVHSLTTYNELMKSKAEREAAKAGRDHLAMTDATPDVITVSALVGQ